MLYSLLPKEELSILDLGCGTGKSTEPLIFNAKNREVSVIGADPDKAMLNEARLSAKKKKLPITYIRASAEKLPFKKEEFDAVISGAAFHWFGTVPTIKKIKKVIKSNGVIFIFWAQYIHSSKGAIGADLYRKYNWKAIPLKFRAHKYVADLLIKSGFKKVKKVTIPFTEKMSIPEAIGNMKTNSSFVLLPPKLQKQFAKEMTRAYKVAMKGRKYEVNNLELRICYGIK